MGVAHDRNSIELVGIVLGSTADSICSRGQLTPNAAFTLIEKPQNTHCIATCYNTSILLKIINLKIK